MSDIRKWIETLMLPDLSYCCDDKLIDDLMNKYHISDISSLYCINTINDIISTSEKDADRLKAFFAFLWSKSVILNVRIFLSALGFEKSILDKLISSEYDTLEKIRKVNYEELVDIGVKKCEAKDFVEQMVYLSDEIDFLLGNNMIRIWGGK